MAIPARPRPDPAIGGMALADHECYIVTNACVPMAETCHGPLTLGYDRHPAVHHLEGAVEAGALVAVVGPN